MNPQVPGVEITKAEKINCRMRYRSVLAPCIFQRAL